MKGQLNPKTGLADPPIIPCYKGIGLCTVRVESDSDFECCEEMLICTHRKKLSEQKEPEVKRLL